MASSYTVSELRKIIAAHKSANCPATSKMKKKELVELVNKYKISAPTKAKPEAKPAAKPKAKPAAKPKAKPATKPDWSKTKRRTDDYSFHTTKTHDEFFRNLGSALIYQKYPKKKYRTIKLYIKEAHELGRLREFMRRAKPIVFPKHLKGKADPDADFSKILVKDDSGKLVPLNPDLSVLIIPLDRYDPDRDDVGIDFDRF